MNKSTIANNADIGKPLLSTKDALALCPGRGHGVFRLLLKAGWLASCRGAGERPLYRRADLLAALERLANGERCVEKMEWCTVIGGNASHLVPGGEDGKVSACGYDKAPGWILGVTNERFKCTICQHRAKGI
jgi:hypothetical protein